MAAGRVERAGHWLAWIVIVIAGAELTSWLVGAPEWTALVGDRPLTVPNTALALTLAGVGVLLRGRRGPRWHRLRALLSIGCGLIVFAIGAVTLGEYWLRVDGGIDDLLTRDALLSLHAGRPSPLTAACHVLVGITLITLEHRWSHRRLRVAELTIPIIAFIMMVAVVGHVFGAHDFYRVGSGQVRGVSITSALLFLLLSASIALQHPEEGALSSALGHGPGAALFRRLVPVAVLGPLAFGVIVDFLCNAVGLDLPLTLSLLIVSMIPPGVLMAAMTTRTIARLHAAVEANRARAQALFDEAPDGMYIADLAGRLIDVNGACAGLLGCTREELIGRRIADLLDPSEARRLPQLREQLRRGVLESAVWTLRDRDGTAIAVEVSAKLLDADRWQGIIRDVRARKQVERERRLLAEVSAELASSLDYEATLTAVGRLMVRDFADWCVLELMPHHGLPRRLKSACADPKNAALCAAIDSLAFTSDRPRLIGSVIENKKPLLLSTISIAQVEALMQGPEHLRLLREACPRSLIAVPLTAADELLGVLVMALSSGARAYQVSDLHVAERIAERVSLAIQNARLYHAAVRATADRDQVLAMVAHDLRNPLTAIRLQLRLNKRQGSEPERRTRAPGAAIERAVTRMSRLLQDILDVTRMEAGELPITPTLIPAGEVPGLCVEAQRPLASAAGLELHVDIPAGVPDVHADRDRLLQVFENLIGNAIKFTDPGGLITVGAAQREAEVLFTVSDTGRGISTADLPHVFDRFWQANKAGRAGTGLGLQIAKGTIERQGGRIWVESTIGVGTTFSFTLPVSDDACALRLVGAE